MDYFGEQADFGFSISIGSYVEVRLKAGIVINESKVTGRIDFSSTMPGKGDSFNQNYLVGRVVDSLSGESWRGRSVIPLKTRRGYCCEIWPNYVDCLRVLSKS